MHRKNRYLPSLFLTAALASSTAVIASPALQNDRVYDREHKDYHHWDDHENQAWHRFLTENHRDEHEFAKSNRKEQGEYWNWRHNHPD
jgi:hypothetical protein